MGSKPIDWNDIKMKLAVDIRESVWKRKLPTAWGETVQETMGWDEIAELAVKHLRQHIGGAND